MRLTAQHLAQGGEQYSYEPQRANNGILVIPDIPGWTEEGYVTLSLESFPLPKESNTQVEARYMNERRKFAGPVNVEDMEVVVKDMVDVNVAHSLLKWRRMVHNPSQRGNFGTQSGPQTEGAVGLAKDYKKNGQIILVAPDGTMKRAWDVHGLWPMSMDPGDIDMTSEDFIRVSVTLSVDRIYAADLVVDATQPQPSLGNQG